MDGSLYATRKRRNIIAATASYAATAVGLSWLALILGVLFWFRTQTTWPGLVIVATGFPFYYFWRKFGVPQKEAA